MVHWATVPRSVILASGQLTHNRTSLAVLCFVQVLTFTPIVNSFNSVEKRRIHVCTNRSDFLLVVDQIQCKMLNWVRCLFFSFQFWFCKNNSGPVNALSCSKPCSLVNFPPNFEPWLFCAHLRYGIIRYLHRLLKAARNACVVKSLQVACHFKLCACAVELLFQSRVEL